MAKFSKFILGFFIGAMVGGATALLMTPYSGTRLREEIDVNIKKTTDDIRHAAQKKRIELETQLESLRAPQKSEE